MNKDKKILNAKQEDFVFVQQDQKIHDVKFETKPTTFMKDAMRRFVRNKSSGVAAMIIGVLMLFSVLVPLLNHNNVTTSQEALRFLPPRWPGFENSAVLNGKKNVTGVPVNMDDPEGPLPVGYFRDAIVGDLKIYETITYAPSPYAHGGKLLVSSDAPTLDVGIQTNKIVLDTANTYNIALDVDATLNNGDEYSFYTLVTYEDGELPVKVLLKDYSADYGVITVNDLSSFVLDNRPVGVVDTVFTIRLGIHVRVTASDNRQNLYINSLVVTNPNDASDPLFVPHNFVEANELLLRRANEDLKMYAYSIVGTGSGTLFEGTLFRADFYYDFYQQAYGERHRVVGLTVMNEYKDLGYIDFTWDENDFDVFINSFVVLNEEKSPVRDVFSVTKVSALGKVAYEIDSLVSVYRFLGYKQIPHFLFGTNERGHDFFKVIFMGLQTSLFLGFAAASINIVIGLIWGSISGYYGGTVDLVMERFTEILGGIPWIVVMTLAILHFGNSLQVFLLALVLTGWIGIAAGTRSQFYRYKRREYVLASRTLGAKDGRLIFKHILPNSVGPIVTSSVLMIPGIIFSEATISYLGLGLKGLKSMGVALSEVQQYIDTSPYLIVSGSIVISLLMISFNLFGNGLRDAFNPSLKGVE